MRLNKTVISLDASHSDCKVGEVVQAGHVMGILNNEQVIAPFDSIVESISFNSDDHTLSLVLVRYGTKPADEI